MAFTNSFPKEIIFTEQQIQSIISLYNKKISCRQIGKQFNCSKQTINKLLRKYNIELRDTSHAAQIHKINESIFNNIDTHEKAYWFGMITGDGCIPERKYSNALSFSLKIDDREYIYRWKKFLDTDYSTHIMNNGIKNDGYLSLSCALTVCNKQIVSDLKKHGLCHNKTHFMTFPQIQDTYLSSYMLGLIDSDGCFCLKKRYKKDSMMLNFSFVGPTQFVETFQNILIDKCQISKTKLETQKDTPFIRIVSYGGYKNIYKIVRFLYDNAPIWMARKKNIAINYLLTKYPNDPWLLYQSTLTNKPIIMDPVPSKYVCIDGNWSII